MMARQQARRLAGAVVHSEGAGNAERIEAVQIAPGRQHLRGAQQIAARRRAHEAPVERMQYAADFVISRQMIRRWRKLAQNCARRSVGRDGVRLDSFDERGDSLARELPPCLASAIAAACRRAPPVEGGSPTTWRP